MKDVFRSGDSSKKFKIAEGQWYRYAPSYVSPAYHLLEGFPFIQEPPSGDLQERVLIRHRSEERRVGKECRSERESELRQKNCYGDRMFVLHRQCPGPSDEVGVVHHLRVNVCSKR